MATLDDNSALLLYRVGPVFCCSPCLPIAAIIEPPDLTHPPGSSRARPGIFKHANAIVSCFDLRYKFGVAEAHWQQPGRTVVTQLDNSHVGFFVDEILDVIAMPTSGWGALPALLPRGIFTRTVVLKQRIHLYAEFQDLLRIPDSGYLRQYIQHLLDLQSTSQPARHAHNAAQATTDQPRPTPSTTVATARHGVATAATRTPHQPQSINPSASARPHASRVPTPMPLATTRTAATRTSITDPTPRRQSASPVLDKHVQSQARSALTFTRHTAPAVITSTAASMPRQSAPTPNTLHVKEVAVRPRHHKPDKPARGVGGLFTLLLVVGILGLGVWYGWRLSMQDERPSPVSLSATTVSQPQPYQAPSHTAVAAREDSQFTPASRSATTAESTDSEVTATPTTSTRTPTSVAISVTPSPPVHTSTISTTVADTQREYHASIEQDRQGVTITLDVPADDPAFKQPPAATLPATNATDAQANPAVTSASAQQATDTPDTVAAQPAPTSTRTTAPLSVEIIHIVVKGDTLWAIAKRYVNNPFRYPELARLSKIRNPDRIYPGNRVRIIKRQRQP